MSMESLFKLVMLIDDNRIDNMVNEKIIKSDNLTSNILVFNRAKKALLHLQEIDPKDYGNLEVVPQVIFLDLLMPEMDGIQFLEEFMKLPKPLTSKIKIFILSSSAYFKEQAMVPKCENLIKYLIKPLIKSNLAEVRKHFDVNK